MSKTNDWGFDEALSFSQKEYEASLRRYNQPVTSHDCEKQGCRTRYATENFHEFEEVWDDFELSKRQRECMFMEVIRSRGRQACEMTLLRQFVSARDGETYYVRLSTATGMTREYMGQISFDTREKCAEYYNYCISLFKFVEVEPVPDSDWEGEGFFKDLDELEGGFFDDLDEMDRDTEGEFGWDTDEGDEISWQ